MGSTYHYITLRTYFFKLEKMTFKVAIFLTCLAFAYINAEKIQCKVGGGASAGSHDADLNLHAEDCEEGITQCMKTGLKLGTLASYVFKCSDSKNVQEVGCTT